MRYFFLILTLSNLILASSLTYASDDYFNRITMASNGRVKRFPNKVISVYVSVPDVPENMKRIYLESVEHAMKQWQSISEELIQFNYSESEDADIRVLFINEPLSIEADPIGQADLMELDPDHFYVKISVPIRYIPMNSSLESELKAIMLHEFGHAIGLWGHSQDKNDVMYFQSQAIYPTRRDKNTLLKLLLSPPNAPYHDIAISELRSDIQKFPNEAHLHFWLGCVFADKGEEDSAIKELTTAIKLMPSYSKALDRLAKIFQDKGMYEEAINYYSKEVQQEPSPVLYSLIGKLYLDRKEYSKSINYFNKALEMDGKFGIAQTNAITAYHLWAIQLIKDGKIQTAISILQDAIKSFARSNILLYDLATAYSISGDGHKAVALYKEAIKLDPSSRNIRSNLAICISNLGARAIQEKDWHSAVELCKDALKWDPNCWEAKKNLELAMLGLARENHNQDRFDEATNYYNRVLECNPQNVEAHIALGDILYKRGLYDQAIEHYLKVLEISPGSDDAKKGLDMISRRNKFVRAMSAVLISLMSMILLIIAFLSYKYLSNNKGTFNSKGALT